MENSRFFFAQTLVFAKSYYWTGVEGNDVVGGGNGGRSGDCGSIGCTLHQSKRIYTIYFHTLETNNNMQNHCKSVYRREKYWTTESERKMNGKLLFF